MNSLMESGYSKEDTKLVKQAEDRVTNARKVFSVGMIKTQAEEEDL